MPLNQIKSPFRDGEKNVIQSTHLYRVKNKQLLSTIEEIREKHGKNVKLLPVSAGSAGGGVFQQSIDEDIIGIQFAAALEPVLSTQYHCDITEIALDQIVIDKDRKHITAGAAITLEQLNEALATYLGEDYKVLGADLTSYTYAQVGSTFMTGGMGPQRRYFSDSVDQIALFDGEQIRRVEEHDLPAYAGTYGWTGIVTAVRCRFYQLPQHEIAFAMPVNNDPSSLAKLLSHLADYTYLETRDGVLQTDLGSTDCILGIEHITADAMGPMLAVKSETPIQRRAQQLKEKCVLANADGVVFISGRSNSDVESFIYGLVDDAESDSPTISGIALEHTEVFNVADEMRAVREAVPAAARGQAAQGEFSFKGHTDANIRLNRKQSLVAMEQLWHANTNYVSAVDRCLQEQPSVRGEILVYGHLNPYGVDPHNRITLSSDNQIEFDRTVEKVTELTQAFFRTLDTICIETSSEFIGGEKGAGSEHEIIQAFNQLTTIPKAIQTKFLRQQKQIANSAEIFSWRALPLYRPQ